MQNVITQNQKVARDLKAVQGHEIDVDQRTKVREVVDPDPEIAGLGQGVEGHVHLVIDPEIGVQDGTTPQEGQYYYNGTNNAISVILTNLLYY